MQEPKLRKIVGLIGASAPGGLDQDSTGNWRLVFDFVAWHYPGLPVVAAELRIEMPVSESQLEEYMTALDPYQIIAVEAPSDAPADRAQITAITDLNATDPDLAAIANRLQMPVELEHSHFGKLNYNRRFSCYEGRVNWGDQAVDLMLDCTNPAQPGRAFETAEALFREQANWSQRVNAYAAAQLLPLKNARWLNDDEGALTQEAFISRMTLASIAVDEDGEFTFWHDDGDLFWGHAIQISGDLVEGLTHADISG